jgi:hypothetical protein
VIADNQLALNAGWDEELLRVELAILHEGDYDLDLLGFDDTELARLLEAQDAAEGLTDEDSVPELPETSTTVAGDVWLLGEPPALNMARVVCFSQPMALMISSRVVPPSAFSMAITWLVLLPSRGVPGSVAALGAFFV